MPRISQQNFHSKNINLVSMNKQPLNKSIIYAELQKHKSVLEKYGVQKIGLFLDLLFAMKDPMKAILIFWWI